MDINYSIENEFRSFDDNNCVFPEGKNYVGIYNTLADLFNTQIHPEIKTKILEIEKEGYYNDHGVDHIKMVIKRASWILSCANTSLDDKDNSFYISPYETFILLLAIHLHDSGHLIASRADHAKAGRELLAMFDKGNLLSIAEKKTIGMIAQAHGGKDDPIGKLEPEIILSHQKVRPQLLAAILRLGDELAEDRTRASNFLLETGNLEKSSEIFHLYSASLDSIDLSNNEIKMVFCFLDKISIEKYLKIDRDVYLIDEIYDRTLKTFSEALYCNRFLIPELRFDKIKVNIMVLNQKNHDDIIAIKYELKELLYPTVVNKNIYEICENLMIEGVQKNGRYVCEQVKKTLDYEKSV